MKGVMKVPREVELIERKSLCTSSAIPGLAAHNQDPGFEDTVRRNFSIQENNSLEQLVLLKAKLANATPEEFWNDLMEGMTQITGAQYAFAVKRILFDEQDSAVEMPPIGEPGSCLMAVALYYNDGDANRAMYRDYKYTAYGAPCSYMKHDKVFMIPDGMPRFVYENPNEFAFPLEAYMGIPLFWEEKCFAHFGCMWSAEGLRTRGVSWGFVEALLHGLEDVVTRRLVEGQGFAKKPPDQISATVIPQAAVSAVQSLKPYARSLSHELRTPMQGVIGMLELMHATVQESIEAHPDEGLRNIFRTLRENIEVVQDSSRRAVEAADNVVHAYDLDMQIPSTPKHSENNDSPGTAVADDMPRSYETEASSVKGSKRRRSEITSLDPRLVSKRRITGGSRSARRSVSPHTVGIQSVIKESEAMTEGCQGNYSLIGKLDIEKSLEAGSDGVSEDLNGGFLSTPNLHLTQIRRLIRIIVNESLRIGGRPEFTNANDTELGEIIEIKSRTSSMDLATKEVEWSVDPTVPDEIYVDEPDLAKLISVLFLNAVKFTERGKIDLAVTLSPKARYLVINVKDTGSGIPEAFRPFLFKPFSREDDSLTRQNEGLGLGLLVAKGLARKVGGDLQCVRSNTDGPERGSEFEIRVPLSPSDTTSRYSTPSRTPTPCNTSVERIPIPRLLNGAKFELDGYQKSPTRLTISTDSALFYRETSPLTSLSPSRRNSLYDSNASRGRGSDKRLPPFDKGLASKLPLTFLVAEDNRINRKLLVHMLSKLGYTAVHEAFDGAEAVRMMKVDRKAEGEKEIDVILMDLWMPNMDGYEATKRIRAMKKDWVKILAVSADATAEALARANAVGMTGFMTKPYKIKDLEKLILNYCSNEG